MHRVRERWVMRRTVVINQVRGLLLERDITLQKGRSHLELCRHQPRVMSLLLKCASQGMSAL